MDEQKFEALMKEDIESVFNSILEVAFGEMGVALACVTCSLRTNQQVIGARLNCYTIYHNVLLNYCKMVTVQYSSKHLLF